MDLQEATIAMAALMKGEADFFREHLDGAEPETEEEIKRHKTALKEFEWLQSNTREFGNQLAANPNLFDIMESWRIVITGKEGVCKNSIDEALKTDNVEDLIERCGTLASSIKEYIKVKGFQVWDMSAGEDGWDISIRCSEKHSRVFCEDIYRQYISAIEMRLITVSRRFAGHCLPGLYNYDDALRILNAIDL